jgi:hypothetical protein
VFLQMPLVVFKRAWDVGVLKDIEHPIIRENVVACGLVVGSDVEKEVGSSVAGCIIRRRGYRRLLSEHSRSRRS